MARHLLSVQTRTRLSLGKSVAQFLGYRNEADYTVLKWLTISSGDEKTYGVYYHEVFDEGSEENLQLDEFSAIDPDDFPGAEFDTVDEALAFAEDVHGALIEKYVAESMINEEYADYFKMRGR